MRGEIEGGVAGELGAPEVGVLDPFGVGGEGEVVFAVEAGGAFGDAWVEAVDLGDGLGIGRRGMCVCGGGGGRGVGS